MFIWDTQGFKGFFFPLEKTRQCCLIKTFSGRKTCLVEGIYTRAVSSQDVRSKGQSDH